MKIKANEGLMIDISTNLTYYCSIGQDYSVINVRVLFITSDYTIDFDEFEKYINSLMGIKSTREEIVENVYSKIENELKPKKLKVITENIKGFKKYNCVVIKGEI